MSTLISAPIARFDNRLRIAASLLRAAPRAEHLLIGGIALASAAAAWPFAGALYPSVAIPALLVLAALIRHHLDGLGDRREALTAAGAEPADALVIQIAGPLGATSVGALLGIGACIVLGRFPAPALLPLAVGLVAALVVRRSWLGAPALIAGSIVALATATLVLMSASAGSPQAEPRSRGGAHVPHAAASVSAWGTAWPTALAAVLTLAAAQLVSARRERIRARLRALTAAAARRMIARNGA